MAAAHGSPASTVDTSISPAEAVTGSIPTSKLEGAVTLHSFDMANMVTVLNLENITVLGSTPSHFEIHASSSAGFLIGFGPDGFKVPIDNIAFTVDVVPEPTNWALLAAGLGLLGASTGRRLR